MKRKSIIFSILAVATISFIASIALTGKPMKNAISIEPSKENTQPPDSSQGLKAYVDPATGEFVSAPQTTDNIISKSPSATGTSEENSFIETHHEDGSVSIDTSNLATPLMATTDKDGKVHIDHATRNPSKEVK